MDEGVSPTAAPAVSVAFMYDTCLLHCDRFHGYICENVSPLHRSKNRAGGEPHASIHVRHMPSPTPTFVPSPKRAVRDLSLKIEESNLRAKGFQRKPKWRQGDEPETSSKNQEDARYEQLKIELEQVKQDLVKLKLDMARVLKEKRHAERSAKSSNLKKSTLSASIGLMKKEIQELGEEQAIVEFARIDAVKELEAIEARRTEDKNRYQIQVEENQRTRENFK